MISKRIYNKIKVTYQNKDIQKTYLEKLLFEQQQLDKIQNALNILDKEFFPIYLDFIKNNNKAKSYNFIYQNYFDKCVDTILMIKLSYPENFTDKEQFKQALFTTYRQSQKHCEDFLSTAETTYYEMFKKEGLNDIDNLKSKMNNTKIIYKKPIYENDSQETKTQDIKPYNLFKKEFINKQTENNVNY